MAVLDRARAAIEKQDWLAAETCLAAVPEAEADAESWYLLGKIRYRLGRFSAAVEPLQKSLEARPDDPRSLFFLSACATALGKPQEAIAWIERYLAQRPEDALGWQQLGLARAAEKSHAAAFAAFAQASALAPEDDSLLVLALRSAEQAGFYAQALPLAERWLARAPQESERLRLLLRLRFLANQDDACQATHAKLLEAEGLPSGARQLLAARIVTIETWELLANNWLRLPLASKPAGRNGRIRPSLTRHDQARLFTPEWLVLTARDDILLEQMTHNPMTLHLKGRHVVASRPDRCLLDLPAAPTIALDDAAILVGGSANDYHWLIDHLPRIGLAHKVPALRELQLLVNEKPTERQWQSLDALGIDRKQVVTLPDNAVVRCRALWVPGLLAHAGIIHDYVAGWLRKRLLTAEMKSRPRRRLHLVTNLAGRPPTPFERELAALLAPLGFETIDPATTAFTEQVAAFAVAEIVVAASQPSLVNILFAPPGALVVEIMESAATKSRFKPISRMLGLSHHLLSLSAIEEGDGKDFAVIEALRRLLADR